MYMELKVVFYSILKNKSVDVVVNKNGVDLGSYNYCNLKEVRKAYPDYELVNMEEVF